MTMLPDFKLETYLAKWEFSARYHMTASDMEWHKNFKPFFMVNDL